MALMKVDILEQLRSDLITSKKQSVLITAPPLELIASAQESGKDILVSGLDQFCVTGSKDRKGRNPAAGENAFLSARRTLTFKRSAELREKVNQKK